MPPTAEQAIQIARAIEQRGWQPTPLHVVGPDGRTCSCPKGANCGKSAGKHNIAGTWQKDTRGSRIFEEMAEGAPRLDKDGNPNGRWPARRNMNVGILTGAPSGIFVLDIDPNGGGMESMQALLAEHGELPPTFIAQTGTGGWHFYFAMPDFDVRNSVSSIAPGVDIRGTGGMVVAPGSVSYAGPYRIAQDLPPAQAPEWLLDFVRPKERQIGTANGMPVIEDPALAGQPGIMLPANPFVGLPDEAEHGVTPASAPAVAGAHARYEEAIIKGELARVAQLAQAGWNVPWDHTTYQVACQLVELANAPWSSLTLQQAHFLFIGACPPAEPGYSPETKWASAEKTVNGKARPEPATQQRTDVFADNPDVGGRSPDPTRGDGAHREGGSTTQALPLSDLGNAERLIHWHGDVVKYAADAGAWLCYKSGVWNLAAADVQIEAYAKSALYLASVNEGKMHSDVPNDPEAKTPKSDRDEFNSWMGKCQMYPKIVAMKNMARSDPRLTVDLGAFDQDPMLLNTANCVVNLSTGDVEPHSPKHLFRHQSPVVYQPGTPAPMWQQFLARVQPDPAMRRYLQLIYGYSLTGRIDEHAFFIHVGTGNNGKTTMLEVISRIMGDYGQKVDRETLLSKTGGNSGSGPTPDIARMAGARLLGASEIPAGRKLDDERVKELVGGDTQTARHLNKDFFDFVPTGKIHMLTNHLPGLESGGAGIGRRLRIVSWDVSIPDSEVDKTLKERIIMTEAAGVLDWLVQGAVEWARHGLDTPESITERSRDHVEDADPVWPFINERLELSTDTEAYETEFHTIYGAYRSHCDANGNKPMSGKALSQAIVERLGHEVRFKHWQHRRSMMRLRVRPGSGVGLSATDGFFGRGFGS